jgi:hypothetical protein
VKEDFGIRIGNEAVTRSCKFGTQLSIVINLTVENNPPPALGIDQGLRRPWRGINDRKTTMRQKKASPLLALDTLTVRPAVRKQHGCMFGGSTVLGAEATAGPGKHENSAHGCISESMSVLSGRSCPGRTS